MGSLEPLPNGNELMGWGSTPLLTEYDSAGNTLLRVKLPGPDLSYRARLEPWVGLPLYPPAGTARSRAGRTTVYASWNGATEVAGWRVLAGSSPGGPLHPVATSRRAGFETAIPVPSGGQDFEVQALDARGHTLGTSSAFTVTG
jgi:hypothetical protein